VQSVRATGSFSGNFSKALLSLGPLLALFVIGCGGGVFTSPSVAISASPATASTSGSSSILTVSAVNASGVTITGTDNSRYTLPATGGKQIVTPLATTTYTAFAVGGRNTASAAATVNVPAALARPTVSIVAKPSAIFSGSSSVLTVTAGNATQVVVTGTDNSSYTLSATGGSVTVTPTATTLYTATATGPGGSATTSANVKVAPAPLPSVNITASPMSIPSGSASVLTVKAFNASQVKITGTDNSSYTLPASGGTQTVTPTATTTYTVVATGAGGTASAMLTVTVTGGGSGKPTITIGANPASITSGGSSVLTVSAANAASVKVTGSDGTSYTLSASGGSQSVTPSATTTYTAVATSSNGTASAAVTVTVTAAAKPTVTISANPTSITAGSSSTLTVSATNATQVKITGTDNSAYTLGANGGTQPVSPGTTTTYTAVATGPGGSASASVTVTVTAPAKPTVTIGANPTSITASSSSTLSVSATNATQVKITGTDNSSYTLGANGGTQPVSPSATTTYTAVATGPGGSASASVTVTVAASVNPTVTIGANPPSISSGSSSTLTVVATNATQVNVTGTDNSSYTFGGSGGTQTVTPSATTTYTAVATGAGGSTASASTTVTVVTGSGLQSINHVIFMLQENRSFDTYFGMLNPYRSANGWSVGADGNTYNVDGIDDKLSKISNSNDEGMNFPLFKFTSTCIDDETSSWLESYGDVSRYDFSPKRTIAMDGFVHTAENYGKNCAASNGTRCSGQFTETTGQRSMGYYDQGFLNYYYYMASQFALSDRWFSPVSSKSIPNRLGTFTGGTTQGLVFDPGNDDHLSQLNVNNIFQELDGVQGVSWKIYYTVTQGSCLDPDDCIGGPSAQYPATDFSYLSYSYKYLYENPSGAACNAGTQPSSVVGDTTNSFCIDPNHIAPLSSYYSDLASNKLPNFAFIEAGYGVNDEHPGSGQSILSGQQEAATVINSLMTSPSWSSSVFFLSYDEGGGPYDHVPPVPGHSNDYTDAQVGSMSVSNIPDISTIAVNADSYKPCTPSGGTPTLHCDLAPSDPGTSPTDAAAIQGFAAQLGFRVPNLVVSPFTRKHYVNHIPMDHTAILKFVENRFIGSSAHLTARDAAQPDLLDFFDFNAVPWATPPTPPAPVTPSSLGYDPCNAVYVGP
jgi:phospholipase C